METGGLADKFGNRYERDWVVDQLLGFLDSDVRRVIWEPLGQDEGGVDVRVERPSGWEAHQVKRSNRSEGHWPVGELASRGVLGAAYRSLSDGAGRFVFVSRDFTILRELAERAETWDGEDCIDFVERRLSRDSRRAFRTLCRHWFDVELDLSAPSSWPIHQIERCLKMLPRFHYDQGIGTIDQQRRLRSRTRKLIETDSAEAAIESLASVAFRRLGRPIHADELRRALRKAGYPPLDLHGDPRVNQEIERHQRLLERKFTPGMIDGELLPRPEAQEILNLLLDDDGPRILWVHGSGGCGKSGVLVEVARGLKERGVPYFPLRWDIQALPSGSLRRFSTDVLELPATPLQCLDQQAAGRSCVLLVDQLDALRWTHAHSGDVWEASGDLLDDASAFDSLRLVVACRTFDLDDDPQIQQWETTLGRQNDGRPVSRRIEIGDLPNDLVAKLVEQHGGLYEQYSDRQKALLRHAQSLALWCRLITSGRSPASIESRTGLMKAFWDACLQAAPQSLRDRLKSFLDTITDYMSRKGTLLAPSFLERDSSDVEAFLSSWGALVRLESDQLTFTHQSYLDYLVAAKVAREAVLEGRTVTAWIRSAEQSLFFREQLRQLLGLLRDQESGTYIETLRGLLFEGGIRFHFRHLVLTWLRAVEEPSADEVTLVLGLLKNESWRPRVWSRTVLLADSWFDALHRVGLWEQWLDSGNDDLIQLCLVAFRVFFRQQADVIVGLLEPYWPFQAWRHRIAGILPWDAEDDTDTSFEWRLELVTDEFIKPHHLFDKKLGERDSARALRLAAVVLRLGKTELESSVLSLSAPHAIKFRSREIEGLEEVARTKPRLAWQLFSSFLSDTWSEVREYLVLEDGSLGIDFFLLENEPPAQRIWAAVAILRAAGRVIAEEEAPEVFGGRVREWSSTFSDSSPPPLGFTVMSSLAHASLAYADWVIDWFSSDRTNFQAVDFFSGLTDEDPDADLIRRFAPHCGNSEYETLEGALLAWLPRGYKAEGSQSLLLQSLPPTRRSRRVEERLSALWQRSGLPERHRNRVNVYKIAGPVPKDEIAHRTDAEWVELYRDEAFHRKHGFSTDLQQFKSSKFRFFLDDFAQRARDEPYRFLQLAQQFMDEPKPWAECYVEALLRAAGDTKPAADNEVEDWHSVETSDIEALIPMLGALFDFRSDMGNTLCHLIESRPDEAWSADTLRLIGMIAAEHTDPVPESDFLLLDEDSTRPGPPPFIGRAAAAWTISALIRHDPNLLDTFRSAIESLASDPDLGVRHLAKRFSAQAWQANPDYAVDLLLRIFDFDDEQILAPAQAVHLGWLHEATRLEPVILRMLDSRFALVQQHAAELIVGCSLLNGVRRDLADRCYMAEGPIRQGVAEALLQVFIHHDHLRTEVWGILEEHFESSDFVWKELGQHTMRCEEILNTAWGPRIAERLLRVEDTDISFKILAPLEENGYSLKPYTAVFRQLIHNYRLETDIWSDRPSWDLKAMPTLLLRLYGEAGSDDDDTRAVCLDLWDEFLESDLGNRLVRDLDRLDAEY